MIDEMAPQAGLVPPQGSPERAKFLRWLAFIIAAIYPTFTYGDDPARWLAEGTDPGQLREATDRQRERSWRQVESAVAGAPWFLGERFSALDIYLGAMTHWRPRKDWFRTECPKVFAVATAAEEIPALKPLYRKHFG
jgi:GST-like protein